MSEIPSPASSSSDGDEALTYEEILEEASMDAHSAANTCSCGEHSSMMAVFGLIESGRVVDAAGLELIVAALGLCKCDEALEFLPHVGSCLCVMHVPVANTLNVLGSTCNRGTSQYRLLYCATYNHTPVAFSPPNLAGPPMLDAGPHTSW